MKKLVIKTTSGIIRAVSYTANQSPMIDKDLAILYLTALYISSKSHEKLCPVPLWFFGLDKSKDYLTFFNRMNLIYKMGNSFSCSEFLSGDWESYEVNDLENILAIEELSQEVFELSYFYSAA